MYYDEDNPFILGIRNGYAYLSDNHMLTCLSDEVWQLVKRLVGSGFVYWQRNIRPGLKPRPDAVFVFSEFFILDF